MPTCWPWGVAPYEEAVPSARLGYFPVHGLQKGRQQGGHVLSKEEHKGTNPLEPLRPQPCSVSAAPRGRVRGLTRPPGLLADAGATKRPVFLRSLQRHNQNPLGTPRPPCPPDSPGSAGQREPARPVSVHARASTLRGRGRVPYRFLEGDRSSMKNEPLAAPPQPPRAHRPVGAASQANEGPVGCLRTSSLWATALSCLFESWPLRGESYCPSGQFLLSFAV
ncbi:uncharacterized protein LOC115304370 [Suricata suricatta]|uniref:uncharacterized protein LOC115304370 n=1 Tax=Suricata suricatta TaxID=37032 RepID=UPI0011555672|nr:uncharacterized protein LOC115304370 [Suricata suricatta]